MDITLGLTAAFILLLVACSAFFSGAETALTGASRARMHQLEQDGNPNARLVNRLRDRKEEMISALLLGNNAVNIIASTLATSVLIHTFGDRGVVYATVVMTVLILIFAEVLPKTYAMANSDKAALAIAPVIDFTLVLLAPITRAVGWVVRVMLRLLGVDVAGHGASTEEELRGAIELHCGLDTIDTQEEIREERAMLRSILDLTNVAVSEVMTHRRNVVMIDAALPGEEVVDAVLTSAYTRVPLWQGEQDNIVGVLHAKPVLREMRARSRALTQEDLLAIAHKPWFTPAATTLFDQLQAFRRRREHFALVVDEYGGFLGVVTLEDILEEIVGDIADEHDVRVEGVRAENGGSYHVDGWVTIRDLNREFDWRLPDESAATIAGLVLYEARRIPEVGQVFVFFDFRFEILARQRNQITALRLTPPADKATPRKTG